MEDLKAFVAEWAERFGFLAVEHAPDSVESINEVAGILAKARDEEIEHQTARDIERDQRAMALQEVLADRELEIRLLRRERRLLVDLDIVKSNVIAGLLSGEVRQSNLNEIERLQKEVLRLHTEARNGVLLPEGVSCGCLLCAPKRDLQPEIKSRMPIIEAEGSAPSLDASIEYRFGTEPEKEN